jgi:hypothetical protein
MALKAETIAQAFREIRQRTPDPRTGKIPISGVNAAARVGITPSNWSRIENPHINQHPGDDLLERVVEEWPSLTTVEELQRLRAQSPAPDRTPLSERKGAAAPAKAAAAKAAPAKAAPQAAGTKTKEPARKPREVPVVSASGAPVSPTPRRSSGATGAPPRRKEKAEEKAPAVPEARPREAAFATEEAVERGGLPASAPFQGRGPVLPARLRQRQAAEAEAAPGDLNGTAEVAQAAAPPEPEPVAVIPAAAAPSEPVAVVPAPAAAAPAAAPEPVPPAAQAEVVPTIRTAGSLIEAHMAQAEVLSHALTPPGGAENGLPGAPSLAHRFLMAATLAIGELERLSSPTAAAEMHLAASTLLHDLWQVSLALAYPERSAVLMPVLPAERSQMRTLLSYSEERSGALGRLATSIRSLLSPDTALPEALASCIDPLLLRAPGPGARTCAVRLRAGISRRGRGAVRRSGRPPRRSGPVEREIERGAGPPARPGECAQAPRPRRQERLCPVRGGARAGARCDCRSRAARGRGRGEERRDSRARPRAPRTVLRVRARVPRLSGLAAVRPAPRLPASPSGRHHVSLPRHPTGLASIRLRLSRRESAGVLHAEEACPRRRTARHLPSDAPLLHPKPDRRPWPVPARERRWAVLYVIEVKRHTKIAKKFRQDCR